MNRSFLFWFFFLFYFGELIWQLGTLKKSFMPKSIPFFPSAALHGGLTLLLLFSRSVLSDSLRPHVLQHARLPCPSLAPGAYSNPCPLSQWCHPTISSCVVHFSCLQTFPASESFQWVGSLHQVAKVLTLNCVKLCKMEVLVPRLYWFDGTDK